MITQTLASPAPSISSLPPMFPALNAESAMPTSMLDRICGLTERLIDVIQRETGLLRAVRSGEAKAVQEEKAALTAAYEAESLLIKALDRSDLLSDPQMPELIRSSAHLAEATADNDAALRSSMRLNSSFMALIARSATASATATLPETYGTALNARYGRARPVAVNTAY